MTEAFVLNGKPEATLLPQAWFLDAFDCPIEQKQAWAAERPALFSNTRVWIDSNEKVVMAAAIQAIEHVLADVRYQSAVETRWRRSPFPELVLKNPGVLFGYDFHITPEGPRLIEINTNAGGAFLSAALGDAWRIADPSSAQHSLAPTFGPLWGMFDHEWHCARGKAVLPDGLLVIVDEAPETQYLAPEFEICRQGLIQAASISWRVKIAPPEALVWEEGRLLLAGEPVSMVYNRLTDFYLETAPAAALRKAWLSGAVVLSPHPIAHLQRADKRHLVSLADDHFLADVGVEAEIRKSIAAVLPACRQVIPDQAEALWASRRSYFFKPVAGFGSRAAYRGDKLTRRVFEEILSGDYVAQAFAPPSTRSVWVDGGEQKLKVDVRNYTYQSKVLGVVARLYQGQTTNFRTRGGGFAPVYCTACSSGFLKDS